MRSDEIFAIIPIKTGHFINSRVYDSLSNQGLKVHIMPINTERLPEEEATLGENYYNYHKYYWDPAYITQAKARNIGIECAIKKDISDYVYVQDCDVVLKEKNILKKAIEILEYKDTVGVVYFLTKIAPDNLLDIIKDHYPTASMIGTKDAFSKVRFRTQKQNECLCTNFYKDLKDSGFDPIFFENRQVGEEIRDYF